MNYENESLELINDVESLMKDFDKVGISDICLQIRESLKVFQYF